MVGRCTICEERLVPTEISALKCGHTFHLQCIYDWLERSPTCPSCRLEIDITKDVIDQLFFYQGEDSSLDSSAQQDDDEIEKVAKEDKEPEKKKRKTKDKAVQGMQQQMVTRSRARLANSAVPPANANQQGNTHVIRGKKNATSTNRSTAQSGHQAAALQNSGPSASTSGAGPEKRKKLQGR